MYPVAPVRKIRIAAVYHSSLVARDTLIDFFRDLSQRAASFSSTTTGSGAAAYSYGEIARMARAFAARLHDAGLRKGDTVVFWSENRPEWIVAFWGCLLRGMVPPRAHCAASQSGLCVTSANGSDASTSSQIDRGAGDVACHRMVEAARLSADAITSPSRAAGARPPARVGIHARRESGRAPDATRSALPALAASPPAR